MRQGIRGAIGALHILAAMAIGPAVLAEELTGILEVEITGLKEATGDVYISVYDSDSNWLSDETVLSKKLVISEARDGDVVRTELHLPLGDYALSAFYDADADGELDTNLIGQPEEPTAHSNNALGKFGSPKFADAVFTLGAEPMIKRIDMRAE
jgi:uncharacterized protein (DUF2141 family)